MTAKYKRTLWDKMPDWLLHLEEGEYTCKEISKISGVSPQYVFMQLEALDVKKKQKREATEYGVIWTNYYLWHGAQYYLDIITRKKESLGIWVN